MPNLRTQQRGALGYSSKRDDARLLALASTMHALTRELVRRTALSIGAKAEWRVETEFCFRLRARCPHFPDRGLMDPINLRPTISALADDLR
jgi:hypothetical protein